MKYPCVKCGCCCRNMRFILDESGVSKITDENNPLYFPYALNADGSCSMMDGNGCSVYDDRPLVCNVSELAKHLGIDEKSMFELNAMSCNTVLEQQGLLQRVVTP